MASPRILCRNYAADLKPATLVATEDLEVENERLARPRSELDSRGTESKPKATRGESAAYKFNEESATGRSQTGSLGLATRMTLGPRREAHMLYKPEKEERTGNTETISSNGKSMEKMGPRASGAGISCPGEGRFSGA